MAHGSPFSPPQPQGPSPTAPLLTLPHPKPLYVRCLSNHNCMTPFSVFLRGTYRLFLKYTFSALENTHDANP